MTQPAPDDDFDLDCHRFDLPKPSESQLPTAPDPEPQAPGSPEPSEASGVAAPSPEPLAATEAPTSPSTITNNAPAKPYLVGVLYYGGIDREHDKCIQALRRHPYIASVFEMHGCPYIDIGRSIIATEVLDKKEYGGLLFFDHDMIFDSEEVTKLIESTEACQGVVGAAYSMRRPGHMIGGIDTTKLAPGEKVVFFEGGACHPASYLGMGMTAIHRSVFERLVAHADEKHEKRTSFLKQEKLVAELMGAASDFGLDATKVQEAMDQVKEAIRPHDLPRMKSGISDADVVPFFSMLQQNNVYYGEDVSFCLRCHDAKIPVQLDTRVRVYHKGTYCYGLEDCGMVVPYCTRLETIASTTNAIQNTPYHVPELQKLLDAQEEASGSRLPTSGSGEIQNLPSGPQASSPKPQAPSESARPS